MALNKEQQQVYEWLSNVLCLPVYAETYKGALNLIEQKPAGYVSFVAHAGRELMNRLAAHYKGIKSERVQYQWHVDSIQEVWRDEWRLSDELSPEVTEQGHLIPVKVCQKVCALIEDHKSGRRRSIEADDLFFSTFLDYTDRDKIPSNFLSEWKAAKEWFIRHTHLREKPFQAETYNDILKHFKCLDGYLYIAASSQYERLKGLNEILDATNR